MKSFTVTRNKWARGDYRDKDGNGLDTALVTEEGDMCCLGSGMIQMDKIPKKDLLEFGTPANYFDSHPKSKKGDSCVLVNKTGNKHDGYEYDNNALTDNAMEINDDVDITEKMREKKLTTLFKRNNIEIKFK